MTTTVSLNQMNRFTLARQGLLERQAGDPVAWAGQIGGLHAQVASTPALSLWARRRDFRAADLERALYEERTLTRLWVMRGTLHVVPTVDLPTYLGAMARRGLERWVKVWKGMPQEAMPALDRLRERIREVLLPRPLTVKEFEAALAGDDPPAGLTWRQALYALRYLGDLVHARPKGKWYYYGAVRYAWRAAWTGLDDADIVPVEEARGRLLLRYLSAFGPATVHDFAYWAGLRVGESRRALKRVRGQLAEVRLAGDERCFWVRQDDLAPLLEADPAGPAPPRLLPRFDPLLMGHRDKERLLDPADKGAVFGPQGEVTATLLLGGRVAGTWQYRLPGGEPADVALAPFAPLAREDRAALEGEVAGLERFCQAG